MSLASSYTLDAKDGTDVVYAKRSNDSSSSSYIDQSTTLTQPNMLSFKHSTTGKGSDAVDRHLIQIQKTVLNTSGVPRTLTVNLTFAVPRDSVITTAMVDNALANVVDFLTDGAIASVATMANVDALLRGET